MRIVNSLNLNWFFSKGEVIYKNINDINFEVAGSRFAIYL